MIGRLYGIVLEKHPPDMLLDVNGVGYELSMPMSCFYQLPDIGAFVSIYTHFIVREDAQLLYGFISQTERLLFRELIKANGVGPKLALAILSAMTANEFVDCVTTENIAKLVKIPGVGKKTAERLVIEMRDKLSRSVNAQLFATSEAHEEKALYSNTQSSQDEAISALIALGYKYSQAEKTVKKVTLDGMKSEKIIREALRAML